MFNSLVAQVAQAFAALSPADQDLAVVAVFTLATVLLLLLIRLIGVMLADRDPVLFDDSAGSGFVGRQVSTADRKNWDR
jgi:hypothetical protein